MCKVFILYFGNKKTLLKGNFNRVLIAFNWSFIKNVIET